MKSCAGAWAVVVAVRGGRAPCLPPRRRRFLVRHVRLVHVRVGALVLCPPHVVGPAVGARPTVRLCLTPPTCREAAHAPLQSLSRHSLVVSPTHASRRTTPSDTVSRAPPSPPPAFVTPVGPLYTSRCGSVSRAPPRLVLPLFSSMTPPPRYMSPSPSRGVMGPSPAPRPHSRYL